MERAVALKRVAKILGKNMGYRVDPKAPREAEREAARRELRVVSAEREASKTAMEDRRKAVLDADVEYQRLKAEHDALSKRYGDLQCKTSHFKITVGVSVAGLFFSVKAQGDTWEQVIAKLTKPRNSAP